MGGSGGIYGGGGHGDHDEDGWDEPGEHHPHDAFGHEAHDPHMEARLDLNDGDRLPWLESDEEDEEYRPRVSVWRVLGAILLAVIVVGAAVAGVWWYTHHHAKPAPVADGSTVSPPPGDYKQAPANPGGKTYSGSGDTSYVVSQGKDRETQLADNAPAAPAPAPAAAPTPAHPAAAAPAGDAASGAAAPLGGVAQIGAYSSEALAQAAWSKLSSQHSSLAQQHHRIQQGQADIGTVWRLQVITGPGGARALCDRLQGEGLACQVKH